MADQVAYPNSLLDVSATQASDLQLGTERHDANTGITYRYVKNNTLAVIPRGAFCVPDLTYTTVLGGGVKPCDAVNQAFAGAPQMTGGIPAGYFGWIAISGNGPVVLLPAAVTAGLAVVSSAVSGVGAAFAGTETQVPKVVANAAGAGAGTATACLLG